MLPVVPENLLPKNRGAFSDGEFYPRDCSFRDKFTQTLKKKAYRARVV